MKIATFAAALALAVSFAGPAHAQQEERVKAELKKKVPEAPVDAVRKISYGGLYEVVIGGDIYYTDEAASFLVVGSIVDLKTKTNITDVRKQQVNAIKWSELPLDQAVKITRGNGSRKVAVFADPNCGYCKRFERDLLGVSDITVYVFLYPILAPDSLEKSKAVWCSADRGKAWLDYMTRDTALGGDTSCATPIDKILALGKEKRVQGTPTIIFENGDRVPGAMTKADFEKKLAESKPAKTASAK
ncbi:MAG: DsbC family protein [Burkholderiales bacterium]|nr:DsbC family protein [Burkholderiales bacterium]